MGNRLPEWLKPRCPMLVARKLGGTTRRQHMGFEGYQELGRLAGAASAALKTPEEHAASCARARAAKSLPLWRAAGFDVAVAPMPYVHFLVLQQIRDRAGVHARGLVSVLGLFDRSVSNACRSLLTAGYVAECPPVMVGHGHRIGLAITDVGREMLERAEEAVYG